MKTVTQKLSKTEIKKIRDPKGIWYGPHECNGCGTTIVKLSKEQGNISLDAPFNHHYPNFQWKKHTCKIVKNKRDRRH